MAKKKQESPEIQELKKYLQDGKAICGRDRVEKALHAGTLQKIYVSSNLPNMEELAKYAKLANVEIISLAQDNEELGLLCKKNFFVSIVGVQV
ncbi:hypothetical protein HOI26_05000 [Candidatus Woesearchaeota archaeon]|jgi:ribosomal protein L30E|nr:hypothetical protein [Candidatus Woesearchaeota archaeon]MBT5740426.1 hypothetical protein [Candidatus Woesearchaeota archaeon]